MYIGAFQVAKYSPIEQKLNQIVQALFESGIINYYDAYSTHILHLPRRPILETNHETIFTMSTFYPIITGYSIGIALSLVVFVLEELHYRCQCSREIVNISAFSW